GKRYGGGGAGEVQRKQRTVAILRKHGTERGENPAGGPKLARQDGCSPSPGGQGRRDRGRAGQMVESVRTDPKGVPGRQSIQTSQTDPPEIAARLWKQILSLDSRLPDPMV